MKHDTTVFECNCGAVTVQTNEFVNSMQKKDFAIHFSGLKIDSKVYNCDYCVNKWGIDLCACGSGEHFEKCKGGYSDCGTPAQQLEVRKEYSLWNH
jgi:hypothetical protein